MGEWRVVPKGPEDREAARIAQHILDLTSSRVVLQRAQRFWLRMGRLPSDKTLLRWMREEER